MRRLLGPWPLAWLLAAAAAIIWLSPELGVMTLALWGLFYGVRLNRPEDDRPWALLMAGGALTALAALTDAAHARFLGVAPMFPSAGDVLSLAAAFLLGLSMLDFARARKPADEERMSGLDAAMLTVLLGMLVALLALDPEIRAAHLPGIERVFAIAFAAAGVWLLAAALRLTLGAGPRSPAYWLLVTGFVALLSAQHSFTWESLSGEPVLDGILEMGSAIFLGLAAIAALHPSMRRVAARAADGPQRPARVFLLMAIVMMGPVLQAFGAAESRGDTVILSVGSGAMFVLVLMRMRQLMVDIREHRRTESALRDAEEKYRTLVEGMPAVVYSAELGPTGDWLYISPRSGSVLGFEPEAWLANPNLWERRVHPDDVGAVLREVSRCSLTGERFLAEYRFRVGDGSIRWIRDEAQILQPAPGRPRQTIQGVMYDITDRKLAEQRLEGALEREREATQHLRDIDAMKNSILNAVSHELRTPLTSILGMSRLLQDQRDEMTRTDEDQFIRRIGVNAERLSRLLSDLLDLDRLSRGILEPNRQRINVSTAVEHLLEEVVMNGRSLHVEVEALEADVDPAQFERIIVNLLTNAVRYTPEGSSVWLAVRKDEGGVRITVSDSGPGVPETLKDRIFHPFEQGDQKVDHSPGVGIGLSLVTKFAALHGGRAWVEDRPGGGASFNVFLACETGSGEVAAPAPSVARSA